MKVLIVDDDEISRFPLASLVGRLSGSIEIAEAADGEEAWTLLRNGLRPALCCCDLSMPNLSGVELLKRTKSDMLLESIPFVMISSVSDRQSVTAAVEAGAVGFIVKPFSSAATLRTLERVLKQSQARLVEPLAQVARRLDIAKSEAIRLIRRLQSDLSNCLILLEEGDKESLQQATLLRIQGSCAMLGLRHAASLLRTDVTRNPSDHANSLILLKEVNLQVSIALEIATTEG